MTANQRARHEWSRSACKFGNRVQCPRERSIMRGQKAVLTQWTSGMDFWSFGMRRIRPNSGPAVFTLACVLGGSMPFSSNASSSSAMMRTHSMGFGFMPLRTLASGRRHDSPPSLRPTFPSSQTNGRMQASRHQASAQLGVLGALSSLHATPKIPGGIMARGPQRIVMSATLDSIEETSEEELPFYRALMHIDGLDEAECEQIAKDLQEDALALMKEALKPEEEEWDNGAELSLVLCGDKEMTELNTKWMGKDYATDVLSFPMDGDLGLLGDIVICLGTARRQAEEGGVTLRDEMRVLLLHGFLHLLGYDHETGPEDMEEMAEAEVSMMKRMGWKGEGLISISMSQAEE